MQAIVTGVPLGHHRVVDVAPENREQMEQLYQWIVSELKPDHNALLDMMNTIKDSIKHTTNHQSRQNDMLAIVQQSLERESKRTNRNTLILAVLTVLGVRSVNKEIKEMKTSIASSQSKRRKKALDDLKKMVDNMSEAVAHMHETLNMSVDDRKKAYDRILKDHSIDNFLRSKTRRKMGISDEEARRIRKSKRLKMIFLAYISGDKR